MRVSLLCVAIAASCAYGLVPCGCPYQSRTCAGCDDSKLAIISTGDRSCTMTCEKGYMLEADYPVNYVECSVYVDQGAYFLGASRDAYSRVNLGSNPALSCVAAPAKTCPQPWKTFECTGCDPSKLVVSQGGAECTLMCDRYYRMTAKGDSFSGLITIGEATLISGTWTMRELWGMATTHTSSDARAAFSCQLIPGTVLPTTLPPTTLTPPTTLPPATTTAPGPAPCGCPYRSKTCTGCDDSKLFLVSSGSNYCTMNCEKGYMLEASSPVNYAECMDGAQYYGRGRTSASSIALGGNPQLSCVKAPAKTCAAGAWKTFECENCDASKIVVSASTAAECTIVCDRYYRLVATKGPAAPGIINLGQAALTSGYWYMTYQWEILKSTGASAADAAFSCQLIPGTVLPTVPPPCACRRDAVEGTYTEECMGDVGVFSCLTGKINVSLSGAAGDSVVIDRATCMDDGTWIGTTCTGRVYPVTAANPFFHCPDVVIPPAPPCMCRFVDAGAALGMDAPLSFCSNDVKQTLKCNGKIYVKNGQTLTEFDSLSCTAGQWSGVGCNGAQSDLNGASLTVQCGSAAEPPLCPQLPSRGGLQYISTENGLQRYTCPGDEFARITLTVKERTVRAKYFECNSTYYRMGSSFGDYWAYNGEIADFSCRDYGTINKACSVPFLANAWNKDGKLGCVKGFYPVEIRFLNAANTLTSLVAADGISTATCGSAGWNIAGTTNTAVRLTSYSCQEVPASTATCGALSIASGNLQYNKLTDLYQCWDTVNEEMQVITPSTTYYGSKLQCVSGVWLFTGSATVQIPAGSKVACYPYQMAVLPLTTAPLIYSGKTPEGLSRWTCIDATVTLDIEFGVDQGKHMPVHAAYIDCNNTHYKFASSISYQLSKSSENAKINSISCTDMGPKHSACSDPWDIGGIRRGNKYECMKGFYLNEVALADSSNVATWYDAEKSDTKSIECTRDGWQLQGTNLRKQRVAGVSCWDTNPSSTGTGCNAADIKMENYKLQFDYYRKHFTCYDGETLVYTLDTVKTYGTGRKLFCGKNSSNAPEWQWSLLDGTQASPIPVGAKFTCF